jgi:hypothetical protein
MAIQLNPEQEQVVNQAIHAGLISVPDDVIGVGVEAIRRLLEVPPRRPIAVPTRQLIEVSPSQDQTMSAEEWPSAFHTWVHSHSTATPVLPDEVMDRESIYALRGL